jgi:four helix bundle protein
MSSFRSLSVWQKADALCQRVEDVADLFAHKNSRLAAQLVEAAASIPANLSEGRGRETDRDFSRFVTMAIGSANEVENHLQRALNRRLISDAIHHELTDKVIEVRKMLYGLRKALRAKA